MININKGFERGGYMDGESGLKNKEEELLLEKEDLLKKAKENGDEINHLKNMIDSGILSDNEELEANKTIGMLLNESEILESGLKEVIQKLSAIQDLK